MITNNKYFFCNTINTCATELCKEKSHIIALQKSSLLSKSKTAKQPFHLIKHYYSVEMWSLFDSSPGYLKTLFLIVLQSRR